MTPADRLDTFIADRRLIRGEWRGKTDDGREAACLLAAMFPEVRDSVAQCPAGTIPRWWAELTVRIDDLGTDDQENPDGIYWTTMRRYAAVAHRWRVLTDDDWQRCLYGCLAVSVREARSHCSADGTQALAALAAIDGSLSLLDRAHAGGSVSQAEWQAAWAAAAWASRASANDRQSAGWLSVIEAACAARESALGEK